MHLFHENYSLVHDMFKYQTPSRIWEYKLQMSCENSFSKCLCATLKCWPIYHSSQETNFDIFCLTGLVHFYINKEFMLSLKQIF